MARYCGGPFREVRLRDGWLGAVVVGLLVLLAGASLTWSSSSGRRNSVVFCLSRGLPSRYRNCVWFRRAAVARPEPSAVAAAPSGRHGDRWFSGTEGNVAPECLPPALACAIGWYAFLFFGDHQNFFEMAQMQPPA